MGMCEAKNKRKADRVAPPPRLLMLLCACAKNEERAVNRPWISGCLWVWRRGGDGGMAGAPHLFSGLEYVSVHSFIALEVYLSI